MTNPAHLSGLVHLDSFIMTPKARPATGALQKPNQQQYLEVRQNIKLGQGDFLVINIIKISH